MKKFNYKKFGEKFTDNLKYGDNLRSVGKKVGISAATLSRAMRGYKIDLETGFRMAEHARLDITEFYK